jgi:hypothetical protein
VYFHALVGGDLPDGLVGIEVGGARTPAGGDGGELVGVKVE